jgi:hypothetical protein
MADSIWIHYARPRPHWYRLAAAEQAAKTTTWAAVAAASKAAGAHFVGRYHVRGQHDFETVEIWRFSGPEAAFDHWARLTAAAYNEWNAFSNNVGLALEAPPS